MRRALWKRGFFKKLAAGRRKDLQESEGIILACTGRMRYAVEDVTIRKPRLRIFASLQLRPQSDHQPNARCRAVRLFRRAASSGATRGPRCKHGKRVAITLGSIVCTGSEVRLRRLWSAPASCGGYERLGEKYGEIFDIVVNQGIAWKPVGPNKVAQSGAVITADFDVPDPPLVWDQHLATPHQKLHTASGAKGRGFEVRDGAGNELTIASTGIQGFEHRRHARQARPRRMQSLTLAYAVTQDADPG